MKRLFKRTLVIFLALVMLMLAGCGKKYNVYENGRYEDKFVSFTMPEDHILALDSTKEMGKLYKNFYTFKGEKDVSGNSIVYITMEFDEKIAKIVESDESAIVDKLKSQYRAKDKSIEVYEFNRLDGEGYKGYLVYFGIGAFGTDIEQDEKRQACVNVVLVRERDYAYSTLVFNSVDREMEKLYLESAKSVRSNVD